MATECPRCHVLNGLHLVGCSMLTALGHSPEDYAAKRCEARLHKAVQLLGRLRLLDQLWATLPPALERDLDAFLAEEGWRL